MTAVVAYNAEATTHEIGLGGRIIVAGLTDWLVVHTGYGNDTRAGNTGAAIGEMAVAFFARVLDADECGFFVC